MLSPPHRCDEVAEAERLLSGYRPGISPRYPPDAGTMANNGYTIRMDNFMLMSQQYIAEPNATV